MIQPPSAFNWASLLSLGVIWGGTFMVVSIALEGYPPLTVACARTTLGAIALIALMKLTGRRWSRDHISLWPYIIAAGLMSTAIPFALLSWGQQFVPSAFAGLSMAALPLFLLPLSHLFSDEKMQSRQVAGMLFGFVGALVLIGPGLWSLGIGQQPLGQIACLSAAFCYALSSILTRNCPPIDPIVFAAAGLTVGAIVLMPSMLIVEGFPRLDGGRSSIAIIVLGFVPTALAALLRVQIIRTAGSLFMSLVNYQVPIWATLFGAVILQEVLPLRFFVALALILTGLAICQWPSIRRLSRVQP